jgi:hypothetical protein
MYPGIVRCEEMFALCREREWQVGMKQYELVNVLWHKHTRLGI